MTEFHTATLRHEYSDVCVMVYNEFVPVSVLSPEGRFKAVAVKDERVLKKCSPHFETCEMPTAPTKLQQSSLQEELSGCRICADRFAVTASQHQPRPVVWFGTKPRILIAGQAPGMRVHASGKPFTDRSGDRLRDWLGLDEAVFYNRAQVAIVPMAFCFPGYDAKGADLPPPPICGQTWHARVMDELGDPALTILVGGYAHRWHLGKQEGVTETVRHWRDLAPRVFPLPHPSWRNTGWLKKNPWFAADLLPDLRVVVKDALT